MPFYYFFFFFNDTATTEIYTLSLHDALPIYVNVGKDGAIAFVGSDPARPAELYYLRSTTATPKRLTDLDRKSTRLNSSHSQISYAVFCLKKKNKVSALKTINDSDIAPIANSP